MRNDPVHDRSSELGSSFPGPHSGWMIFGAGLAMLVATVLIPPAGDLETARLGRDIALARESHELARIERHRAYLDAFDSGDERLLRSLAMTQLNLVPTDRSVLPPRGPGEVDVFGPIEPDIVPVSASTFADSTLSRIATDRRGRLWLLAGSALCLFVGLMPPRR